MGSRNVGRGRDPAVVTRGFGRLTSTEHRAVYREGRRYANEVLVIYARQSGRPDARVGLSVSKQLGGAVRRNRVKRRVREACHRKGKDLPAGVDLIVIPRATAADAAVAELEDALGQLLRRVELRSERPGGPQPG